MTPRFAVLLATYNGGRYLIPQIDSILSQIDVSVDIYVRDDNSADNTLELVKKYVNDGSIKIIKTDQPTGSPAGNFFKLLNSINIIEYDYIALSDQDDIWFPEKLISAVSALKDSKADSYSSDLIAFDNGKSAAWFMRKGGGLKKYDYLFQGASAGCTYVLRVGAAVLVRNVLGDVAKNFPKGYSHDWLIYAICRSHGIKWFHDNRAFIAYRQHSVNAFGAMPGIGGLLQRLRLSRSGWYREQVVWQSQFLKQSPGELRVLESVKNFGFKDRFYLATHVSNFRRSHKDCFLLAVVILLGLL